MTPFYTILTNYGKTALAEALAAQKKLEIPHMAVGDGGGSYYDPLEAQTNLRNELWRGDLNDLRTDDDIQGQVIAEAIIPMDIDGDWTVREIGLFDKTGGLIAVGKYPEVYIPPALSGAKTQVHISIIIKIDNVAAVQLIVDHGQVLASKLFVRSKGYGIVGSFKSGLLEIKALSNSYQLVTFESEYGIQTYCWQGEFPKDVPIGSTPQTTGGIGDGAWARVGDASLRSDLGEITKTYSNINEMKRDDGLYPGALVRTNSYNALAKIGGATYRITSNNDGQNNCTKIPINNGDLSAELVWDSVNFDASWGGAKLDQSTDDADAIQQILTALGRMNNTYQDNLHRDINIIFNRSFYVSKSIWCGYNNLNIIMNGDCLLNDTKFTGNVVFDFDYGLLNKPVNIPLVDYAKANGGGSGWNKKHKLSFINQNTGLSWKNDKEITELYIALDAIPRINDEIFIHGRKIVFGSDVHIGATVDETTTNLLNYLNANQRVLWSKISGINWLVCYQANPFNCITNTSAVRINKWNNGLAAVRQSNAWNCEFNFVRCFNFPIQLFEEPVSKTEEDGTVYEFGSEQCTYSFGKSQNCQIVHLIAGRLITSTSKAVRNTPQPYSIDHHIKQVSSNAKGIIRPDNFPHYTFAYFGKVMRITSSDNIEMESGRTIGVENSKQAAVFIGASDAWLQCITIQAKHEMFNRLAVLHPAAWIDEGEPHLITIKSKFPDYNQNVRVIDSTARKGLNTNYIYAGRGHSITPDISTMFNVQLIAIGNLYRARDTSVNAAKIPNINWYKNDELSESKSVNETYISTIDKSIRCDGFNGMGISAVNETGVSSRLWVSHRGGESTKLVIRMYDIATATRIQKNNLICHHGDSVYNEIYNGFVSNAGGNTAFQITIASGYVAQIFVMNVQDPSKAGNVTSFRAYQHWNEPLLWIR